MSQHPGQHHLSIAGLTVLTLAAGALSAAALMPSSPAPPTENNVTTTTPTATESSTTSAPTPATSPLTQSSPSTSGDLSVPRGNTVVIVGDQHSVGKAPDSWASLSAAKLGWNTATNQSVAGRGHVVKPFPCTGAECSTFQDLIGATADMNPDLVITMGGTADDDRDLRFAARKYYEGLRGALPEAQIVAVSPITTDTAAPYWLTMHTRTIRSAVEAVDGTFIDVGQPALGDGDELSSEAHATIAEIVTEVLS